MRLDRLVVASQNPDKIAEVEAVLAGLPIAVPVVRGLAWDEIPEIEDTLEGNALLKARAVAAATGVAALADDTGLEVAALGGAPGVHTARYAGANATYADNVAKLLTELGDASDRSARFRTVVALVTPDGDSITAEGVLEGRITRAPRGDGGFGYDPVFAVDDRTLAEIPAEEKNRISHRALALQALARELRKLEERGDLWHFRAAAEADAAAVQALLAANEWAGRVPDAVKAARLIAGADRTVTVWAASALIGFGRALCDDVSNGYLSMIVVAPSHRGRGIGRAIVDELMGDDPAITWVVRAGRSRGFWERIGFVPSTIAMEKVRGVEHSL